MDNKVNEVKEVKELNLPFTLKADIDETEYAKAGGYMIELHETAERARKAHSEMTGDVAKLLAVKAWKYYEDCKGINQLVHEITGASNGTVSNMVHIADRFYNANGTLMSKYARFNWSELRYLLALSDDEIDSALLIFDKIKNLTRKHVEELVNYIKKGNDVSQITVGKDDRFNLPDSKSNANDNTGNDNTGNDNTGNDNTGNDNTGNDTSSTGENEKTQSTRVEQSQLSKEAVETILNTVIKLRADTDRLSKSDIKKQLDKIIEDLGVISK